MMGQLGLSLISYSFIAFPSARGLSMKSLQQSLTSSMAAQGSLRCKSRGFQVFLRLLKAPNSWSYFLHILLVKARYKCSLDSRGKKPHKDVNDGKLVDWITNIINFHKCLDGKCHCCNRRNKFLRCHLLKGLLIFFNRGTFKVLQDDSKFQL